MGIGCECLHLYRIKDVLGMNCVSKNVLFKIVVLEIDELYKSRNVMCVEHLTICRLCTCVLILKYFDWQLTVTVYKVHRFSHLHKCICIKMFEFV